MADGYPPYRCPGHNQPCAVKITNNGGPNNGRPFYACSQSPKCKHWFQWADERHKQPRGRTQAVVIGSDVRLSIVRDGGQLRLKVAFEYDEGLIILCREFRGYYKPELSAWLLPIQHKEDVERRLAQLKETGAGLMPHQREAVEFVVGNRLRGLVADDMGLGKTVTAIGVLAHADVWPALVLCPSSVKYNWRAELLRWLPEQLSPAKVQVVDKGEDSLSADASVVIATYDGARARAQRTGELNRFRAIVCDESHNLKSPEAQRTRALLPLVRRAVAAVLLSGTPALSRPYELWTQASAIAPTVFPPGGLEEFGNTYCGGRDDFNKFSGATNLGELEEKLRRHVMVRRTKDVMLRSLPPKIRSRARLKEKLNLRRRLDRLLETVGHDEVVEWEGERCSREQLQNIQRNMTTELWLDEHADDEKVLVFAHHAPMLDAMRDALKRRGVLLMPRLGASPVTCSEPSHDRRGVSLMRIDGTTSAKKRMDLVQAFQDTRAPGSPRVALLSINAAGVGITLTAAHHVIFAELSWTPGVLEQCVDRVHRLGQRAASVEIAYLVYGPFDDEMWFRLKAKQRVLDESGTVDLTEEDTVTADKRQRLDDGRSGAGVGASNRGESSSSGAVGLDLSGDGDALLANGASVRIHGLVNTGVKYNGRRGEVVEFIRDRGRYLVRVRKGEETEEVSLKRENLTAR
ncbi:hypothetical protein EMIHUDRAFT_205633 [Emiliania huxleyi CCMP1516]|uniref:Uncharacterized protein n=2 Tax=Emiliania huxleyi TaxID=2903 RepID=A0A0D3JSR2_EMIH1|nr:hypothetical protein EMIHUDRAFT_205633 [Emiliania huxleyi CCMP1516]EOD26547.1 hypothetical protein EMIHUDRAFT_205633 [Emiliania huxleyi CCMP1516]|eukprot:XP_005778976.1 hypothetical protein EMIHUDRAFT_205633 [Emiliania huxleyi CCMP1516]